MMLRTLSDRTTTVEPSQPMPGFNFLRQFDGNPTFIFSNILERKRQARIFPLNDAYFAKSASADNSKQTEVV
jgi:hypothetical protein